MTDRPSTESSIGAARATVALLAPFAAAALVLFLVWPGGGGNPVLTAEKPPSGEPFEPLDFGEGNNLFPDLR